MPVDDEDLAGELFHDELSRALAKLVLEMQPGDRLPSERELAQQFNVSRTALRDRLSRLGSMGVIERRTGAGTFVRGLRPETVSETLTLGLLASGMSMPTLISVREALERQAAREAALSDDPVKIAYMAAACQRLEATDDPAELYAADLAFHKALFSASGSPALAFFAEALSGVLSRSVQQRGNRILQLTHDPGSIRSLHRAIYVAVASGDPTMAMRTIDAHFAYLDQLRAGLAVVTTNVANR